MGDVDGISQMAPSIKTSSMMDIRSGTQFTFTHLPTTAPPSGNFSTNVTRSGGYGMPMYAQVLIILLYSAIIVLAIGGNLIVCYIVLAYQRMRTVTNYFIVNMAVSDILMSAICIPFTFVANLLMQYWPFGAAMCPIVTYAQSVAVFLGAFTLVAISLDRYIAIIYPLRRKMTTNQAIVTIISIWILSLLVPLPIAILSRLSPFMDNNGVLRDSCDEIWPNQKQKYYYSLAIMVLQYFLPLFVLSFTYARIGIVIWIKKPPGEAENKRDQRMAQSKRKMVKMMITVVIIYTLCWLPLHTITLVGDAHPNIYGFRYIQVVWTACHWLAMSNCCYNPMVYCWMNNRYREGFKYVLHCHLCRRLSKRQSAYSLNRKNTYASSVRGSMQWDARGLGKGDNARVFRRTKDGYQICSKVDSPIQLQQLSNGCTSLSGVERQYSGEDPGYSSGEHTTFVNDHALLSLERQTH